MSNYLDDNKIWNSFIDWHFFKYKWYLNIWKNQPSLIDFILKPMESWFHRWWLRVESNHRHRDFQSLALPTELQSQLAVSTGIEPAIFCVTGRRGNHCTTRPYWLREKDLNLRPLGYEPNELPGCSIPRCNLI